jgi:hypothetical protein
MSTMKNPLDPVAARDLLFAVCLTAKLLLPGPAAALDQVTLTRDGQTIEVVGQVITDAADGGLLLQDREGLLWAVQPEQIVKHTHDDRPYEPMRGEELEKHLLGQLPAGFRIHRTTNYLVGYNTSLAYAHWCGALYERLFAAFRNYWSRRGLELHEPPMPLVALVFDDEAAYARYAQPELGEASRNVVGYYSLQTNRVTMYDLTGAQGLRGAGRRLTSSAQINQLLMQPGAERMVATIIHEATHQLAFNCGMHQRYADIPLWVSEGLAVYFETPDLGSSKGWRTIGQVNQFRLHQFRQYLPQRPANALPVLVSDDGRFRQSRTALDAYAEAWALNYFLISSKPEKYAAYLKILAEKKPLIFDTPETRLAEFTRAFGGDLPQLDADFLRYMKSLR